MLMNRILILLVLIAPMQVATLKAQKKVQVSITNPANFNRTDAVVAIAWSEIVKISPRIDTANLLVFDKAKNIAVPYQLEHKGKKQVQNLLVQVSLLAKQNLLLELRKGKPATYTVKTYARFVPERKDDFAWENDKIAFRMYGKALEQTRENAHGIDVWAKRTTKMVINDRYKLNKYHIDNGDGLDYYHVGATLGAGNIAPYLADSLWYLGNFSAYKVLDNGPLRSTFQLFYDEATAGGLKIKTTKTISIDAGSQLNKIENIYTYNSNADLPVAIGFITRNESEKITMTEPNGTVGYWEPEHGKDGITGVGAILPVKPVKYVREKKQLLAVSSVKSNQPMVYYAGAAWNKAGEITTSEQWFNYLKNFKNGLAQPIKVKVFVSP